MIKQLLTSPFSVVLSPPYITSSSTGFFIHLNTMQPLSARKFAESAVKLISTNEQSYSSSPLVDVATSLALAIVYQVLRIVSKAWILCSSFITS
jgi:hypothetical protein